MPICETVAAVLDGSLAPQDGVACLMGRDAKHESYGE